MTITRFFVALSITFLILLATTLDASEDRRETSFVRGELLVKFKAKVSKANRKKTLNKLSVKSINNYKYVRIEHVKLPRGMSVQEAVRYFNRQPQVEFAEPNYIRRLQSLPNDPQFDQQWSLHNVGQTVSGSSGLPDADIDMPEAWDLMTGSNEVVVAVLDTGVDYLHPDLMRNIWRNPSEILDGADNDSNGYIDDIHGVNTGIPGYTLYPAGDPMDIYGHGSHVAGIIASSGNNFQGTSGINWKVKILPVNVFSWIAEWGIPAAADSSIIGGINYVLALKNKGVNIVATNHSYGGPYFSNGDFEAMKKLANKGILTVVAAGNESANNDLNPMYPANYGLDTIIAVAATDQNDNLASFSNYGNQKVHIAAPGTGILSEIISSFQASLKEDTLSYSAFPMAYAGLTAQEGITKKAVYCGFGLTESDFPPEVAGNIALIERGSATFAAKASNAINAGAAGAVVFNNVAGNFKGTLGPGQWIPVISITRADGLALVSRGSPTISLVNSLSNSPYEYYDGTSMAAPHVTGIAALVAGLHPDASYNHLKKAILSKGDPITALQGKILTGMRLNAYGALTAFDDLMPETTLSYSSHPTAFGWHKTVPTIDIVSNKPGVNIYYAWNTTSSFELLTAPFQALSGTSTLNWYSEDTLSNKENIRSTEIRVDKTPPIMSSVSPPSSKYLRGAVTLSFYASDTETEEPSSGVGTFMIYRNTQLYDVTSSFVYRMDTNSWYSNAYLLRFKAVDKAGNISPQITRNYYVDNRPPYIASAYMSPTIPKKGTSVKIFFKVNDVISPKVHVTLQVRTAKGTLVNQIALKYMIKNKLYYRSIRIPNRAGSYTFSVVATDYAGNRTLYKRAFRAI